jgi:DnaJ family protein B protein 12
MEANKSECEKCLLIAKRAAADQDFGKAIRFIEKSIRLYPTDDTDDRKALLKEYKENFVWSSEQQEGINKIKSSKDYYHILGVQRTCSEHEIKRAYKRQALKYHPDKCKASGTQEAFQIIAKAFDVLSDKDKRRSYDHFGLQYFDPDSDHNNNNNNNKSPSHFGGGDGGVAGNRRTNSSFHDAGHFHQHFQQHHYHHHQEEIPTDELFNLIFAQFAAGRSARRF